MRRADAEMRNAIALRVNNSRIRVRRRVAGVAAVAAVAATPPTVYLTHEGGRKSPHECADDHVQQHAARVYRSRSL